MNFSNKVIGKVLTTCFLASFAGFGIAAAPPSAQADVHTVSPGGTSIDLTGNDSDPDGDVFWIEQSDIAFGDCPINTATPFADGMVDLELGEFSEPCTFSYRLTSRNLAGGWEYSQRASVTLIPQVGDPVPDKLLGTLWTDSSGNSYSPSGGRFSFGDLVQGSEPVTESFVIGNGFDANSGVVLNVDLDLLSSSGMLEIGAHDFGNAELTVTLAPQQSVSFDLIADPSTLGEVSGSLRLAIANDPEPIILHISIVGQVLPGECIQEPFIVQGLPGTIQAESYDLCGYVDTTPGNQAPPVKVRPAEDVDAREFGGRAAVSQTSSNEWMDYALSHVEAGIYHIRARYSYASDTLPEGALRFVIGDVVRDLTLPQRSGAHANRFYSTTLRNVYLPAGAPSLRVQVLQGGFNLDEVEFDRVHGDNSAPEAVPDEFYALGDRDELTLRKGYFLRNDRYDPYLLNPWDFQLPEIVIVNPGTGTEGGTRVNADGNVVIDLSGLPHAGDSITPATYRNIFTYKLTQGGLESSAAAVDVRIDPDALLLVANDDSRDLPIQTQCFAGSPCHDLGHIWLTSNDYSANASPPDDGLMLTGADQPSSCDLLSACTSRTFYNNPAGIGYTPDPRLLTHGSSDTFVYEIQSTTEVGQGGEPVTANAVVHLNFVGPPVANDDFSDHPLLVQLPNTQWIELAELLANDGFNYTGTHILLDELDVPSGMQVSVDSDGYGLELSFEAPGSYRLGYQLEDGLGQRSEWAWVHVDAANNPPVATDTQHIVLTGRTGTDRTRLSLDASDPDGDSLTVIAASVPAQFGSTVSVVGGSPPRVDFTPIPGRESRGVPITFTVTDGFGTASAVATVIVRVSVPFSNDDQVQVSTSGPTTIELSELLSNDRGSRIEIPFESIDTTATNGSIGLGECGIGPGRIDAICFRPSGSGAPTSFTYFVVDRFGQRSEIPATVELIRP